MKRTLLFPAIMTTLVLITSFTKLSTYAYDKDLLTADFHKARREAFRAMMPENSVAVFFSNTECYRANDVEYDFHQDPDFYYLTGYTEPDGALIIFKNEQQLDSERTEEVIFVQERDPSEEVWTGRILGIDDAKKTLGITTVASNKDFGALKLNWSKFSSVLLRPRIDMKTVSESSPLLMDRMRGYMWKATGKLKNTDYFSSDSILNILRKRKTPEELTLLRKAISITNDGHIELMKALTKDMTEYQVQAILEYEFKKRGAEYEGYPSICGSGENSCILHYTSNRRNFDGNELIVVDAGAEYHGYSADVTRTLPVCGKFSPEQKLIYQIVLGAQLAGIEMCRAGNDFRDPHRAAVAVITKRLKELGIIQKDEEYRNYFIHGSSHHIGLDVHDGDYEGKLEANNIITMEPGIYIPEGSPCDKKWWNIGVRIEDDILITSGAPEVISGSVPKTVNEIEATMAGNSYLNSK